VQIKTKALRERKPPPTAKFQPKVIRDANPDFRINPDVCRICPKMLWMHYLVGVSHFAKYGTKSVVDCMRNGNKWPKIPYSAMVKKMKSDPESTCRSGSAPKVNHF